MDDYQIQQEIGDGSFGTVLRAIKKSTGEVVALKKLKKKYYSFDEVKTLREVQIFQKIPKENQHSGLVRLKEVFRDLDNTCIMEFEHMDGNLFQLMRRRNRPFAEKQVKCIMYQLFSALSFIHTNGYFHRDLKPENILYLRQGEIVKLGDFGLTREIRSIPPYTAYVSTRWYRAPELLMHSDKYNSPVDLWALGCIMAELFLLKPLFPGDSESETLKRIEQVLSAKGVSGAMGGCCSSTNSLDQGKKSIFATIITNASAEAIDLIERLLVWEPNDRIKASVALRHKFFEDVQIVNGVVCCTSLPTSSLGVGVSFTLPESASGVNQNPQQAQTQNSQQQQQVQQQNNYGSKVFSSSPAAWDDLEDDLDMMDELNNANNARSSLTNASWKSVKKQNVSSTATLNKSNTGLSLSMGNVHQQPSVGGRVSTYNNNNNKLTMNVNDFDADLDLLDDADDLLNDMKEKSQNGGTSSFNNNNNNSTNRIVTRMHPGEGGGSFTYGVTPRSGYDRQESLNSGAAGAGVSALGAAASSSTQAAASNSYVDPNNGVNNQSASAVERRKSQYSTHTGVVGGSLFQRQNSQQEVRGFPSRDHSVSSSTNSNRSNSRRNLSVGVAAVSSSNFADNLLVADRNANTMNNNRLTTSASGPALSNHNAMMSSANPNNSINAAAPHTMTALRVDRRTSEAVSSGGSSPHLPNAASGKQTGIQDFIHKLAQLNLDDATGTHYSSHSTPTYGAAPTINISSSYQTLQTPSSVGFSSGGGRSSAALLSVNTNNSNSVDSIKLSVGKPNDSGGNSTAGGGGRFARMGSSMLSQGGPT